MEAIDAMETVASISFEQGRGSLNAFFSVVHTKITAWGIASMVASALLLLAYSYSPRVRRTPGWHFLYSSICEFYVSFGIVSLSLAGDSGNEPDFDLEHAMCHEYNTLLLSILGFDMAANGWRLFMFVDLIVVYHNPFWPHQHGRPIYHVFVGGLALSWVIVIHKTDLLCLAASDGSVNVLTLTWGLVYAPFILFVLLGGSLYIMVKALLSRHKTNTHLARLTRQRVMRHCLFYLVLYGVMLGVLSAGYANYQYFTIPLATRTTFADLTAALTSGRPVFGFLGWLLINIIGEHRLCCAAHDSLGAGQIRSLPAGLREPLIERLPGRSVSSSSRLLMTAEDAERASYVGVVDEHDESLLANSQGVREAGFKEELRYELVSDVAMSISELAEHEAREQQEELLLPVDGPDLGESQPCTPSPKSDEATIRPENWITAQGRPQEPNERLPHVDHYAVAHFRAIRKAFGISAENFAAAFRRSQPESSDAVCHMRESVSEGASGSFFYWVKNPDGSDTGYIVKQITKKEKDTLMGILPAYKSHVQASGGSSLLQYLSCHSMRLRWELAGKVYFVVMRNFFPLRPQMSFDLKGATANRRALNTWELHQTSTVAGMYSTLRDWEWMDIGMTTDLDERDKAQIWSMVTADCDFLVRQNLLDYSLLLGIYRPPSTASPAEKQELLRGLALKCRGTGFVSLDLQKVYFFGIIDVLETFTIRWRLQRAILRLLYAISMRWSASDGISAMPPALYADRFRTFTAHEVLQMEEEPEPMVLDESWRGGRWCADLYALSRRLCGLPVQERAARRGGKERWGKLWERRRRGLVKQRIVSQHEDLVNRISELEEKVRQLDMDLACASGAHERAALREHDKESKMAPTQSLMQSLSESL